MRDYGAIQAGFDDSVKETMELKSQAPQLSTLLAMSVPDETQLRKLWY